MLKRLSGPVLALAMTGSVAHAAITRAPSRMGDHLEKLRSRVMSLEQDLVEGLKGQHQAKANIKKIQLLLKLQKEERELGKKRLKDLEKTVSELESRRGVLRERIKIQQESIRRFLIAIEKPVDGRLPEGKISLHLPEAEKIEAPRRKVLANLVDRGLKEIEALRVDLADAEKLEGQIQEEQQQLAYVFQDLTEQEGVLELNRQLQLDLLKKRHQERVVQLENYRKLKNAEASVERLIKDFNARLELEHAIEQERSASRAFARLKGNLPLPVSGGKVVSSFGRVYDPKSRLHVFKKGIDLAVPPKSQVRAVSAGKVAFSGELPDYGRVAIIDHGDHFYSLCAHLGELTRKVGDSVAGGDFIGQTDDSGTPVYFEIRSRNVPVNPLQWISN